MPFSFNFERGDEHFVAKVRTTAKREMDIPHLEANRVRMAWWLLLVVVCSATSFILSLVHTPLHIDTVLSSLLEKAVMPLCLFPSFLSIDTQIKTLKLARRIEQDKTP